MCNDAFYVFYGVRLWVVGVISSLLLVCVVLKFGVPQGVPIGSRRQKRGTSGVQVKQHFAYITSGFAPVKPHSVNLHPCASVKA